MKPSNALRRIAGAWNRYWFLPAPTQRLAVCRLFAFGLLVVDLLYLGKWDRVFREIDPFFWEPILCLRILQQAFGFGLPPPPALGTIYIVTLIMAVGAFVGYRTGVCALVSSCLYIYLMAVVYSGVGKVHHTHGVFVLLLFALSLSPCGAALSVDALRKRVGAAVNQVQFCRNHEPETSCYVLWPLRLIGILLCLVYFFCGYSKLRNGGLTWMNGETLAYWLLQDADVYSIHLPLLVAQYPLVLQPLSILVVALELTFPVILLFPGLLWLYLPAGFGFHMGTFALMNTHFVWWWFTYMVFIDWEAFGRWLKVRLGIGSKRASIDVLYDGRCPLCIHSVSVLAYIDWFHRLEFRDVTQWSTVRKIYPQLERQACMKEMHVIESRRGKSYTEFFGFRRIAKEVPLMLPFAVFLSLPGAAKAGCWAYRYIAGKRRRIDGSCTAHTCGIGL
jgi:predicted DCC family thiol-disulfide oxidoreductase YuxK